MKQGQLLSLLTELDWFIGHLLVAVFFGFRVVELIRDEGSDLFKRRTQILLDVLVAYFLEQDWWSNLLVLRLMLLQLHAFSRFPLILVCHVE
jgi:hypothetical protein